MQRADSVDFIAILALRVLAHETDTLRAELARHHAHVPAQSAADASCAPVASENEHVSRANLIYPSLHLRSPQEALMRQCFCAHRNCSVVDPHQTIPTTPTLFR